MFHEILQRIGYRFDPELAIEVVLSTVSITVCVCLCVLISVTLAYLMLPYS